MTAQKDYSGFFADLDEPSESISLYPSQQKPSEKPDRYSSFFFDDEAIDSNVVAPRVAPKAKAGKDYSAFFADLDEQPEEAGFVTTPLQQMPDDESQQQPGEEQEGFLDRFGRALSYQAQTSQA